MARVQVVNAHRRYRLRKSPLGDYVRRVLRQNAATRADVRIVCIDSRYSRTLNRRYLDHDDVTDVICFPLERGARLEGEVYVNLDRARRQAREYGVSFASEVARLVIHGTLHLVGFDDVRKQDAHRMRVAEDAHMRHWFPSQKG